MDVEGREYDQATAVWLVVDRVKSLSVVDTLLPWDPARSRSLAPGERHPGLTVQ